MNERAQAATGAVSGAPERPVDHPHVVAGIDPADVPHAFDRAAQTYDRLVAANPGYHEHLRLSAQRLRLPDQGAGLRLLDIGCGTGASTAALLAAAPKAQIVAVDGSEQMVAQARRKAWPGSVRFVHARAEELGQGGVQGPFDGILAAHLVRNLPDADRTLVTLRELLRPGATMAVHEYSVRHSRAATAVWNTVAWSVIVPAGTVVARDSSIYRYLWRSVLDFDGVQAFSRRLRAAGYVGVRELPMTGWQRDIVHTFLATRPLKALDFDDLAFLDDVLVPSAPPEPMTQQSR